ncbi:MAG TPA: amino acid permease [Gemmatimonadaceae bacterium]|nr:amino acid permease [Gemmatimonadaceae bacterium]
MTRTPGEAGLVRALGVWGLAASIVNITIGGGIFRAPGTMEVTGRLGAAAPLAYVVCAIAMVFVVMCFAEAGSRVALTGGPYAYVERAFGTFAGFVVGWLLWVTGTIATAAVATIFADSLQRLSPALSGAGTRLALLALVFAVVTAINVRGVKGGARLNIISTVLKLAPLALLIVVGLANLEPANLEWERTPSTGDVGRASVFLIFAFAGIESAMVPSGEVREPGRTVPRAVLLALGLVTVFYLLVQVATQGVLGASLAGRSAPLSDAAGAVMGPFGAALLGAAVVVSTFGYLSGMILAIPRALFAFARDGVLPNALAAVHPRFHTPWVAIIVQSVIALALALRNPFEKLAMLANVAALLVYLGCAAAAWQLRRKGIRDDESTTLTPLPGSAVAPALAAIVIVALLASVTLQEWIVSAVVTAAGASLYLLARFRGTAVRARGSGA